MQHFQEIAVSGGIGLRKDTCSLGTSSSYVLEESGVSCPVALGTKPHCNLRSPKRHSSQDDGKGERTFGAHIYTPQQFVASKFWVPLNHKLKFGTKKIYFPVLNNSREAR